MVVERNMPSIMHELTKIIILETNRMDIYNASNVNTLYNKIKDGYKGS